jgi:hypothetical protein
VRLAVVFGVAVRVSLKPVGDSKGIIDGYSLREDVNTLRELRSSK